MVFLDGSTQTALEAGFADKQEGFATINVAIGYAIGEPNMRIEGYVSNLTDEEASQKSLVGSNLNLRFLNDARAYGIRLISRF